MKKFKVGMIGGSGYTGGELLRLLLLHPNVEVAFVQSTSNAGKPVYAVHTDLLGETDINFSAGHQTDIDALFLCGGRNAARKFLTENTLPEQLVVIDLSQDFRHTGNSEINGHSFIYGQLWKPSPDSKIIFRNNLEAQFS